MKAKEFRKESLKRNRVLLKSFLENWKNYIVFFMSTMLTVAITFTFLSVRNMLVQFREGELYVPTLGTGKIITDGIKVMAVMTVFLMVFALKYYVMTRTKDYGIYKLMGIKQSLLKKLLILEYAGSIVCSFIGGYILGNIFSLICSNVLSRYYFKGSTFSMPGGVTYLFTFLICMFIFFLSLVINNDIAVETNMISITTGANQEEKCPLRLSGFGLPLGMILIIAGTVLYNRYKSAEEIYCLIIFFIGIVMTLYYGGCILLEIRRKNKKYYYKHLLYNHHFYYQFKSNMAYIIMLFGLQFLILFYYPVQLLTNFPIQLAREVYPYDFVWKMDKNDKEEQEILNRLENISGAECIKIPAVAVTVAKGDNTANSVNDVSNQGQNIGIPESAYTLLTGKELGLKENEIHVALQQGKGRQIHPLDFFGITSTYLHFGPAYPNVLLKIPQNTFTTHYHVRDIENGSIIGEFGSGSNENLIVFSDEVFKGLENVKNLEELVSYKIERDEISYFNYDTPVVRGYVEAVGYLNQLVLVNVPQSQVQTVNSLLYNQYYPLKEGTPVYNPYVRNYYSAEEAQDARLSELVFRNLVHGILYGVFVFADIFLLFVKIMSEGDEIKREEKFYRTFGMKKKNKNKAVYRKMKIYFILPTVLAIAFGSMFTVMTLRLRFFTTAEAKTFLYKDFIMAVSFLMLQFVIYHVMKIYMHHRMEGR